MKVIKKPLCFLYFFIELAQVLFNKCVTSGRTMTQNIKKKKKKKKNNETKDPDKNRNEEKWHPR